MAYMSTEAKLTAIRAKDSLSVGFETSFQRPFGGSGYDSDEQIGIAIRKTFYDGKKIEAEVLQAESDVKIGISNLQAIYRESVRTIQASRQQVEAMNKAIALAEKNAAEMQAEINYLKQQLIIGESTIDSVLSAEARLYDINARQVNYLSDKRKAELAVLSGLGLLSEALQK